MEASALSRNLTRSPAHSCFRQAVPAHPFQDSPAVSTSYSAQQGICRPRQAQHHSGPALYTRRSLRANAYGAGPPGTGLSPDLKEALDNFISKHPVVLFMKGTKQFPQCGFSNTCVQILNMMNVPYETVNILEDELLRSGMKEYSQWPTFPQVYIGGEFFGGCDIMIESFQKGELPETLEAAVMSHDAA